MCLRARLLKRFCLNFYLFAVSFFYVFADAVKDDAFLHNIRQLTFEGVRSGEGYFSADGQKMIYQSESVPNNPFYQIQLLDFKTGDNRLLSTGIGKSTCAWIHPSGNKFLYSSTHLDSNSKTLQVKEIQARLSGESRKYNWDYDENYDIFSSSISSVELKQLTHSRGYDAEASFSPSGKKIVFTSNRHAFDITLNEQERELLKKDPSFFNDLYLMNEDGSNVKRITDTKGYDGGPFFNSSGEKICWRRFSLDGHKAEIYTMSLASGDEKQITRLEKMSWAPFFHPTSKYIIFSTNLHGFNNFELYIVDAAGSKTPVRVTNREGFDGLPSFSPDGKTLSWTSNSTNDGKSQIFLADWNHNFALSALGLSQESKKPYIGKPSINELDTKSYVDLLSSSQFNGRATGTDGSRKAAEFVSKEFQRLGMKSFNDTSWFQKFPFFHTATLDDKNFLRDELLTKEITLQKQWTPSSLSESGDFTINEIIFAGFGIRSNSSKKNKEYDSYVHLGVKEKWVMVLDGLPNSWSEEKKLNYRFESTRQRKARLARDLGATGIIFVNNPRDEEKTSFSATLTNDGISIKSFIISKSIATHLFNYKKKKFNQLVDVLNSGEQVSGITLKDLNLKGNISILRKEGLGINTLGWLMADETRHSSQYLVIGAHIDHIGRGKFSSRAMKKDKGKIHPGADDNASGIAALIEIAQKLADLKKRGLLKINHDILFAAWSGEEIGLIGSRHFVKSQNLASADSQKRKIIAYLNMDMIGRMKQKLTLHGVGSSSKWTKYIQKANIPVGLNLNLQMDSHVPTDSTSFISKGIPILSAFTGLHSDYHSPADTADKINHFGLVKCADLFSRLLIILCHEEETMDFLEQTPPKKSVGKLRSYLGTIPNYSQTDIKGVLLSGVTKGGPADKAGLKEDDLIFELNGLTIENIYDYTDAIGSLKPGNETTVQLLREGLEVKISITPEAR